MRKVPPYEIRINDFGSPVVRPTYEIWKRTCFFLYRNTGMKFSSLKESQDCIRSLLKERLHSYRHKQYKLSQKLKDAIHKNN